MATLILAFMMIGFVTIPIMTKLDMNYKEKIVKNEKRSKLSPLIIWIIIMAIIGSVVIGLPIVHKNIAIGDGVVVSTFDRHDLYYEESTDTYFIVQTEDWNVAPIVVRKPIDNNKALEIIGQTTQFNELNDILTNFYN